MKSITQLGKRLLLAEYELVKPLYEQLVSDGVEPEKAAAIMYHKGYLDGRDDQRERESISRQKRREYWESQQTSPTSDENEGSIENV